VSAEYDPLYGPCCQTAVWLKHHYKTQLSVPIVSVALLPLTYPSS